MCANEAKEERVLTKVEKAAVHAPWDLEWGRGENTGPCSSHTMSRQSPALIDLEPPEEQSPCHELEFQPLQESGEKPQQEGGWWQSMGRGIFLLYQEGWVDCNGNKLQNPGS